MYKSVLLFASCLVLTLHVQAQSIHGVVKDSEGEAVPGATVMIVGTGLGSAANFEGVYRIDSAPSGRQKLKISAIGFEEQFVELLVKAGQSHQVHIDLEASSTSLEEITIVGKSEATQVREQAYAVSVVEAKALKNSSADVNQILNRVSGINIRQNGGMGSNFNLSLNGLSGNRVRTFINGVPMDYFGSSLSLNNFPANLISTIEIYKGAVPIHLSSDALGGAINIVTDTRAMSYLDASFSYGSFNTQTGALNGQWHDKKTGLTFRLKSFYNHSDNDYPIDINILNTETGNLDEETTEVKRFHDAYSSQMVWAEVGVMNKSYADELMVGVVLSGNYKELQQNPYATGTSAYPVGEAETQSDIKIFNLSYRKKNLFVKDLNVRGYAVYLDANEEYVDTSSNQYDWFGDYRPDVHVTTGELGRKTHFYLNRTNFLANANAEYAISSNHNLSVNYSINRMELQGRDDFQPQNNTQFSNPNIVNKQVTGLGYTHTMLADRLSTTLFAKNYDYLIQSNIASYDGEETEFFETKENRLGYGLASTFFVNDNFQVKASFEKAFRFPESYEMYGDGLNVIPNPSLEPESSNNYNVGIRFNSISQRQNQYMFELNAFVRDSENYIRFEPKLNRSTYVNDKSVLARGIDLALRYAIRDQFSIGFGGTYLDLRNSDKASGLYGDRLPNEPYIYSNLILSYSISDLLGLEDQLTITNINRYVHDFYLKWESLASQDKSVIQSRLTNDLQLTYSLKNGRYNVSFLVSNMFDAKVYDNFNQQNPGRAFNLKLRYFISKN
ncbi:TonB-dependent receptor [Reichenbachiella agariperforans]|uniref:TonB-dependent receptor n=1 Tax=Reichenbachiella agariperforans TaxID=156994 RepID=UPI001C092C2B|nr:TonB-dependent receptor [Reichenbachiella agariperforans]MBU2913263.1 TonB-dependent receptor [Reichenbachiella agariperforans]